MLKSDTTKAYHQQDLNDVTTTTTTNTSAPSSLSSSTQSSSLQRKIQLTDEKVELYIQAIFELSPRSATGTAPAYEWLQFLELYNEREGHYILTRQQKNVIKPYCEMNHDVEMTPEDFIRLLYLIRCEKLNNMQQPLQQSVSTPLTQSKKLFDGARPRSSRLMNKKSLSSYYEDRESVNHPDHNNDISPSLNNNPMMMLRTGAAAANKSGDPIETDETSHSTLLQTLRKEKNLATRQLKEYENRISNMSKEHLERISQLQTRLEFMNIEAENQKNLLLQQKHKERERLDKIAELQAILDDSDNKNALTLKKQQKQQEEYEKKLSEYQASLSLKESKIVSVENELAAARDQIRILEKEKADLSARLDSERRLTSELRMALKEEQEKNTKLMEIIDRQKFDLDEARAASQRTNSPAPNGGKSSEEETTLAQEEIKAEYMKKIAALEKERDEYQHKLVRKEEELSSATAKLNKSVKSQQEDKITIANLSAQFDREHKLMESIKSDILLSNQTTAKNSSISSSDNKSIVHSDQTVATTPKKKSKQRLTRAFTVITYIFFFYHTFMILINSLFFGSQKVNFLNPYIFILQQLDEWITAHLSS